MFVSPNLACASFSFFFSFFHFFSFSRTRVTFGYDIFIYLFNLGDWNCRKINCYYHVRGSIVLLRSRGIRPMDDGVQDVSRSPIRQIKSIFKFLILSLLYTKSMNEKKKGIWTQKYWIKEKNIRFLFPSRQINVNFDARSELGEILHN